MATNLTVQNAVTYAAGVFGLARSAGVFRGMPSPCTADNWSIQFTVVPADGNTAVWIGNSSSVWVGCFFGISLIIRASGSDAQIVVTGGAVVPGAIMKCLLTGSASGTQLYVNGKLECTTAAKVNRNGQGTEAFGIGGWPDATFPANALIDEVSCWSYTRAPVPRPCLMSATKPAC